MSPTTKLYLEYTEQDLDRVIEEAVEKHGSLRDAIIPILSEVNQTFGYIPAEGLGKIRRYINTPDEGFFLADSHLYSIASFYHMFSLQPLGKHVIRYCASAPCHVEGGRQMIRALEKHLGIKTGETSPDKQWSLMKTSCLGVCAVGPVFLVDEDIYGQVTPEKIPAILAKYH
jgi:NADH:ubiquinone oxidoreductase subunit E